MHVHARACTLIYAFITVILSKYHENMVPATYMLMSKVHGSMHVNNCSYTYRYDSMLVHVSLWNSAWFCALLCRCMVSCMDISWLHAHACMYVVHRTMLVHISVQTHAHVCTCIEPCTCVHVFINLNRQKERYVDWLGWWSMFLWMH